MIDVTPELLDIDPYPTFAQLRDKAPIAWIPALGIYYATRWADCDAILRNAEVFSVGADHSLIRETFGEHMLTLDGPDQLRMKREFLSAFTPKAVQLAMTAPIEDIVEWLIQTFPAGDRVDLRSVLASRLPILAVLALFGIDQHHELRLRSWYNSFEAALANFARDAVVAARAAGPVAEFHVLLRDEIAAVRRSPKEGLLSRVVRQTGGLSDDEIIRNASIIFFGAISTVEALLLNTLYALGSHDGLLERAGKEPDYTLKAVEETMRWLSPVQSATRHVANEITLHGVTLKPGDTINCMLGSANRDADVFADAEQFRPGRPDGRRHLGFASGPHFCLGSHLARLEVKTAIDALLRQFPALRLADRPVEMRGYEFRQPEALWVELR